MKTETRGGKYFWLSLGLALGWLSGLFISRRQPGGARRIAQLEVWEESLAEKHGPQKAALLAAKVQARYENLYSGRPRFYHRALRFHLESRILPGIALYQILLQNLREETTDREAALADLDCCFAAHVQGSSLPRQLSWMLNNLPGAFAFLRVANRLGLRYGFPKQGWQYEWVEDSPRRIAYDITGCFYLNVLRAYGASELTAHFCALDDQLYGNLNGVAFERSQTLGRGDPRCDFQFRPRQRTTAQ